MHHADKVKLSVKGEPKKNKNPIRVSSLIEQNFSSIVTDESNPLSATIPDSPTELKFFVKLCEQRRKFPVLYKIEFTVSLPCNQLIDESLTSNFIALLQHARAISSRPPLKRVHVDMQRKRTTWRRIKIRKQFRTTTIASCWRKSTEFPTLITSMLRMSM